MKRFIAAALCVSLALMLTACGTSAKPGKKKACSINGCTLTVDTGIWKDVADKVTEQAGKKSDSLMLGISKEDIENMTGGVYVHADNKDVSFNLISTELGDLGKNFDIGLFIDPLKEQYKSIKGCTVTSCEKTKVNGQECLRVEVELSKELAGKPSRLTQYMFIINGKQYVVSYGAAESDYSKYFDKFKEVLDTISFT